MQNHAKLYTQVCNVWACQVMFEGKIMSLIQKSNIWSRKGSIEDILLNIAVILTRAEATCLAMVNIRLSVISHGGSTRS